ncbi:MAG: tyrosine-type recombinase/integrase [Okeania sp. SIO3I5]|uniref:tyrosine-type recombinase/integrase n=1 Tax=Okeania sp. SIO3I5 TaxID=2607805 RepID=UPI0013BBE928|nr:tyrosine-type recombinase/integrase [Okeania sp. SIO3I5]NEQ41808.1 tyrosine-type recombinase/integrase [Okeania sp. SIO3I5]
MKRKYLFESELQALFEAAKSSGKPERNLALVITMYRHGLRANEALAMQWEDINFPAQEIFIRRAKGSVSGAAPLWKDELNALRKYQQKSGDRSTGYIWLGENSERLSWIDLYKLIKRLGKTANLNSLHPHQLRNSFGYHIFASVLKTARIRIIAD